MSSLFMNLSSICMSFWCFFISYNLFQFQFLVSFKINAYCFFVKIVLDFFLVVLSSTCNYFQGLPGIPGGLGSAGDLGTAVSVT